MPMPSSLKVLFPLILTINPMILGPFCGCDRVWVWSFQSKNSGYKYVTSEDRETPRRLLWSLRFSWGPDSVGSGNRIERKGEAIDRKGWQAESEKNSEERREGHWLSALRPSMFQRLCHQSLQSCHKKSSYILHFVVEERGSEMWNNSTVPKWQSRDSNWALCDFQFIAFCTSLYSSNVASSFNLGHEEESRNLSQKQGNHVPGKDMWAGFGIMSSSGGSRSLLG